METIYKFLKEENIISSDNEVQITKAPFKFQKFGQKEFYLLKLNSKNLVLKEYRCLDLPMLFNGDNKYTELQFIESLLLKEMKEFYKIPFIERLGNKLLMEDVSEDLKRFGTPKMPTAEEFKSIITSLAKKDAKLLRQIEFPDSNFSKRFELLLQLFEKGISNEIKEKFEKEWNWFLPALRKFKFEAGEELFSKIVDTYQQLNSEKFYKDLPLCWQHGDFFFNNIGLTKELKPVVIDWESLVFGPMLYDYASLTAGMPRLPFIKNLKKWYLESYNEESSDKLTSEDFDEILAKNKILTFFHGGIIDALRLIYANNSPLPREHQTAFKKDFFQDLNYYICK